MAVKPDEVPSELLEVLRSSEDDVRELIAQLLTKWEQIRRKQIREDNKTSMYGEMLAELGNRVERLFTQELGRHGIMFPTGLATCRCEQWAIISHDDGHWRLPYREHVAAWLVKALEVRGWLPHLAAQAEEAEPSVLLQEMQKHTNSYSDKSGDAVCACGNWSAGPDPGWRQQLQAHVAEASEAALLAAGWVPPKGLA